jgi:tRNA threonylcarbamoyladenosine biosynthesis protein TsaB
VLILAFDTSALAGSAALLDDERILAQMQLPADRRSAQTLAPAIDELLRQAGQTPAGLGLVATTIGPGSFTGLRVGVTTAKTLAYAIRCDVIGLDTLDVIAAQAPTTSQSELHAVMDAQRKELFLARYRIESGQAIRLAENQIIAADTWLPSLAPGTIVTGPGLAKLSGQLPPGVVAVDAAHWEPQATTIGRLAFAEHRHGRRDDLWKLAPAYLRASAAEEKRATMPAK